MPTMTPKEIETAVEAGNIKLLSVDTSILKRYNFGLEHGLLSRLRQFAKTDVNLVLSDVVIGEMTSHMIENVETADQKLGNALKEIGGSRDVTKELRTAQFEAITNGESANECVAHRINEFKRKTDYAIVNSDDYVSVSRIVKDFFNQNSPFEQKEVKKNEFPDAIALQGLEAFAASKETLAIVVSSDIGWERFCEDSDWLICEKELAPAMSRFQKLPGVIAAQLVILAESGKAQSLSSAIDQELDYFVNSMTPRVEAGASFYYEPELQWCSFEGFQFPQPLKFTLIDQDEEEERFDFRTRLDVTVEAGCTFDFSVMDEGDHIPIGGAYVEETNILRFEITFSIYGDLDGEFDVEGVEILDHDTYFDFGHVEP